MAKPEVPATFSNIQSMATEHGLSKAAHLRALQLADLEPTASDWAGYIDRFLATVGSLLIIAGIATFFAWNWTDLHHLMKLALIQGAIAVAALLSWRLGIDSIAGRAGLFSTAFFVGILFAVFGQVYQTGADPYGLFIAWAILILPIAIIGRQAALWILLQILLNLALIMYWTQVIDPPNGWWQLSQLLGPLVWLSTTVMDSTLASLVFTLNAIALLAWEMAQNRKIAWMRGRTFPRVIGLMAFSVVLIPTIVVIIGVNFGVRGSPGPVSALLFIAASMFAFYYYRFRKPDLLMLTMVVFGAIFVFTTLFARFMVDGIGGILLLAILVIAQVAGAALWLRRINHDREVLS